MNQYKGHPIYGVAIPTFENRWYSRGLVFDRDLTETIAIKRIEATDLTFKTSNKRKSTDWNYARHGLMSRLPELSD